MRVVPLLFLVACSGSAGSDDTEAPDPDEIVEQSDSCEGDSWAFSVTVEGLHPTAVLHVKDTGPANKENSWSEEHDEPVRTESDGDSRFSWSLEVAEFQVDFVENITTLARCDDAMSWAVQVFDDGGELVDCVAWGEEPEWFDEGLDSGCRVWE